MNWITILGMMAEAETHEAHLRSSMNQAISSGKPFKDRPLAFLHRDQPEPLQSKEELRERVRNLRNPNTAAAFAVRKMGSTTPPSTDTSKSSRSVDLEDPSGEPILDDSNGRQSS
jgi:hypothetical protein